MFQCKLRKPGAQRGGRGRKSLLGETRCISKTAGTSLRARGTSVWEGRGNTGLKGKVSRMGVGSLWKEFFYGIHLTIVTWYFLLLIVSFLKNKCSVLSSLTISSLLSCHYKKQQFGTSEGRVIIYNLKVELFTKYVKKSLWNRLAYIFRGLLYISPDSFGKTLWI